MLIFIVYQHIINESKIILGAFSPGIEISPNQIFYGEPLLTRATDYELPEGKPFKTLRILTKI